MNYLGCVGSGNNLEAETEGPLELRSEKGKGNAPGGAGKGRAQACSPEEHRPSLEKMFGYPPLVIMKFTKLRTWLLKNMLRYFLMGVWGD